MGFEYRTTPENINLTFENLNQTFQRLISDGILSSEQHQDFLLVCEGDSDIALEEIYSMLTENGHDPDLILREYEIFE